MINEATENRLKRERKRNRGGRGARPTGEGLGRAGRPLTGPDWSDLFGFEWLALDVVKPANKRQPIRFLSVCIFRRISRELRLHREVDCAYEGDLDGCSAFTRDQRHCAD